MRRAKKYIGSSLEPCMPPVRAPNDGRARMRPTPTRWREDNHHLGHACTPPLAVRAPWPYAPPERASCCRARLPLPRAPSLPRVPSWPCMPPLTMHAPHAHPSLPFVPRLLCAPPRDRACPSLLWTPHVRAFLTRVHLPSISSTNLMFISPLGHPNL
jgi:hypothetical protein